jgi:hypothetical protein
VQQAGYSGYTAPVYTGYTGYGYSNFQAPSYWYGSTGAGFGR